MTNINEFLKRFGSQTTTNFDLLKIGEDLALQEFEVCMRDELRSIDPLKAKGVLNVITNLHTSGQKGVHWSACRININDNYFFDSYGLPPTNEVKEILGNGIYNTFQIQKPGTSHCGQLCLYVLYKLQKGVPFLDIMLELHQELPKLKFSFL